MYMYGMQCSQVTDAALNPSTLVEKPTGMERVHLAQRRMPAVELRGMHACACLDSDTNWRLTHASSAGISLRPSPVTPLVKANSLSQRWEGMQYPCEGSLLSQVQYHLLVRFLHICVALPSASSSALSGIYQDRSTPSSLCSLILITFHMSFPNILCHRISLCLSDASFIFV
jgi:hypothetical protein